MSSDPTQSREQSIVPGETPANDSTEQTETAADLAETAAESHEADADEQKQQQDGTGKQESGLAKALKNERLDNKELRTRVKELEADILERDTRDMVKDLNLNTAQEKVVRRFATLEERTELARDLNAALTVSSKSIAGNRTRDVAPRSITIHDDVPMFGQD
jgi:hypothetical protein